MSDLQKLKELAGKATPGPWILATSNSWRRLLSRDGHSVCEPIKQKDGHPDLWFRNGGADGPDAKFMEAASPDVVLLLCEVAEKASTYFAHYLQDEADDEDVCVCGREQHERAKALRAALHSLQGKQA